MARFDTPATTTANDLGAAIAAVGRPPRSLTDVVITITGIDGTPVTRFRAAFRHGDAAEAGKAVGDFLDDYAVRYLEMPPCGPVEEWPTVRQMLERSIAYEDAVDDGDEQLRYETETALASVYGSDE